ncbi:MAG TPA: SHOCT domain-containing protein [Candidatus Limnocylindrales bacterium]
MPMEIGLDEVLVWLLSIAVIGGIPVAVIAFVFAMGQRSASDRPEEVLRSRFARGEITRDEFEAGLRALGR